MAAPAQLRLLTARILFCVIAATAFDWNQLVERSDANSTAETPAPASERRLSAVCTGTFAAANTLVTGAGVIRAVVYVPHSTKLLVAGGDNQVLQVWKLDPFSATVHNVLNGHFDKIWALKWIDTHSLVASGSNDGTIRFWSPSVLMTPQSCSLTANCCDGDGLGCEGQHVVSWRDLGMSKKYKVHALEWVSPKLYSAWEDLSIRVWTYNGAAANPSWSPSEFFQSTGRIHDMLWVPIASGTPGLGTATPDERLPLFHESALGGTRVDLGDGTHCPWSHCDAVLALATSDPTLATGGMDNRIILWNMVTKTRTAELTSHTDYVSSLAWLATDTKLASGSKDNSIKIWSVSDTATDQSSATETLTGHSGQVNSLIWMGSAISQGQLVSGSSDGTVRLWTCTR